jgi:ferric-dicitrate binding protein FerR (iron transport regulator)
MNKKQNNDLPKALSGKTLNRIASLILVSGLLVTVFVEFRHYAVLHRRYPADIQAYLFVSVPRGECQQVELPDGTKVWLNAASLLKYPSDMSVDRTVELTGEAFFDVNRSTAHPFCVKAREVLVEVLGTRFDMRWYPEEITCKTAVAEGAIKVVHGEEERVLHAGDEAEVEPSQIKGSGIRVKKGLDPEILSNWTKGLLEFYNDDLTAVLQDLSRAYNVDIQFDGAIPPNRFYGSFSMKEPVEKILNRLDCPGMHIKIQRRDERKLVISVSP